MNIQRKNSAHHFRMQSEREQTLGLVRDVNWQVERTRLGLHSSLCNVRQNHLVKWLLTLAVPYPEVTEGINTYLQ